MALKLRIKEILKSKGITSKEFAAQIGKAPQYVSNIINGGKGASMATLSEIADALGVEMGDLFTSSQNKNENDFVALIRFNGNLYQASSIQELDKVIIQIKASLFK